jgi:hypothetical protein
MSGLGQKPDPRQERPLLARSGHAASTLFKFACAGPRLIDAYALFYMRNPPIVIS